MLTKRERLKSYLKRLIVTLGIVALLSLVSSFQNFGYFARAQLVKRESLGGGVVLVNINITYNPVLFPLSWLAGKGYFSGPYDFYSMPQYVGTGEGFAPRPKHPRELEQEAILSIVLGDVSTNFLFNMVILFAIKLTKMQDLYFCLVAGMIGFPIGGFTGSMVGFLLGLSAIALLIMRFKKGNSILAWTLNFFFKEPEAS